ncbi:C-type lectin domain family 4 member M-like [Biomphalaria glabrata]|uniref:C-type lectin domain family 4 member M-like n=1 Tax=Biomphalaria glabrata TaxID=6526 RepID=A0A9W2ZSZ1_BIOGL|nr:C-type lectin domain family 4 member M-like [Biomphalaria glabrata]
MRSTCAVYVALMLILFAQGKTRERLRKYRTSRCEKNKDFQVENYNGGSMCLFWSKTTETFFNARADCQARGARLGVFKGADKMEILFRQKDIWRRNIWIGLDDTVTKGTFVWHDGTVLQKSEYYPLYFSTENPSGATQDCIQLWIFDNKLDDFECHVPVHYVCEKVID